LGGGIGQICALWPIAAILLDEPWRLAVAVGLPRVLVVVILGSCACTCPARDKGAAAGDSTGVINARLAAARAGVQACHPIRQRLRRTAGSRFRQGSPRLLSARHRAGFMLQCRQEAGVFAAMRPRTEKDPSYLIRVMPA
jgi:hypothetical protein